MGWALSSLVSPLSAPWICFLIPGPRQIHTDRCSGTRPDTTSRWPLSTSFVPFFLRGLKFATFHFSPRRDVSSFARRPNVTPFCSRSPPGPPSDGPPSIGCGPPSTLLVRPLDPGFLVAEFPSNRWPHGLLPPWWGCEVGPHFLNDFCSPVFRLFWVTFLMGCRPSIDNLVPSLHAEPRSPQLLKDIVFSPWRNHRGDLFVFLPFWCAPCPPGDCVPFPAPLWRQ